MRLSHIKLAGFKSFVDPTHIHLPGQIAGIVGPNGCGKSNVIDALRWVLGESKASALRGESMQDVIFNGSGNRKPVARASVELVFDNSLGKAAGQWSSYAEISIKRVLLRSGDSSYLINNQKVRRRDITDIFLGTGLGARAYAIVEQGMISRIIEAKPEELRIFLEEAAGVSKYRDRRRETSLRLNDTRDNLLRVDDILQEMEKQLLHLGEQATIATRYRELESQRDTAQQLLWLIRKQESALQRAGFATKLATTHTELEAQMAVLRETESHLEITRAAHYRLSDALHARQGELYGANAEIARLEQQIKHSELQRQRLNQQIASATRLLEQQQQQRQSASVQLEHWQAQQEEAAVKLVAASGMTVDLNSAEDAARAALDFYNGLQREKLRLEQQLLLAATQHGNAQRNSVQLQVRHERLAQELANLQGVDHQSLDLLRTESAELEVLESALEEKRLGLQQQLPEAERQRQRTREAMQLVERQESLTVARLHALQQLQRRIDHDKNLNAWLIQHQLDGLPRLWQWIRIESGWENALEAVLRERLNAVRVDTLSFSDTPAAKLALFEPADEDCDLSAHENLSPLLGYVECQDRRVLSVIRAWLASVYAAADLSDALKRRDDLPRGGIFVTPEGHLIDRYSVLFHAPDSQLHGVLLRQREIEQLENELIIDRDAVDDLKKELSEAENNFKMIEVQIPPLHRELAEIKQRQHALQMQIFKLNQAHEKSAERSTQISAEIREILAQRETELMHVHEFGEQMEGLRGEIQSFSPQLDSAERQVKSAEAFLREQQELARRTHHALQEANFFVRTCQDKIADLHGAIQNSSEAMMLSEQNLQELQSELSESADETSNTALQSALQARAAAERALSEARINLESAGSELQRLEQARIGCEQQSGKLREQLAQLTLKEQEARLYFEQWAEKLQGVDESRLLPQLANVKSGALQNDLLRFNREIEALGAVNLAALAELKAANERKQYLDAQALDLQQAMATLEDAIRHIDRESRELLMETYNRVNEQLSELFPILFAGGEARLVLTGDEILDSGVQVMAQPPGKKNSTIHLLSGGEKALTAIALIFSLFRLNPAPFCLLDEVDAPLDDTNTERLCALVRKMSQHTQFVFISHNKIAMEMAQQLIGVTMQEKGVSRVVSVDIEEALRLSEA